MENTNLSIGDAASLLIGAGLTQLDNLVVALALIGVGVGLKVMVAVLQKQGLDIKATPQNLG